MGTDPQWNSYCLNGTDFNTAGEYLTIGATSIAFLKNGFYRINFWTIAFGPAYGAVRLLRNGNLIQDGASQAEGTPTWHWRPVTADVLWPFEAGDQLTVQTWNPGLYAFHAWNALGQYSRLQVQYVGPSQ
jgi:hypothetical protein